MQEAMMGCRSLALFAAAVLVTLPAFADDAAPDTAGGRYIFSKQADGGFVRLDTQSGAVALCSQKPVGWACEAAPEDRAALENEIDRLRADNAALKKTILAHGLALPSGIMPEPQAQDHGFTVRLPSDADIDRAVALMGHVWQRFVAAVERAQKQVLNKS